MILVAPGLQSDVPFSAAHLLASAHSTSLSSSLSDLFPTRTTTRFGLASALASANHRERLVKELRLHTVNSGFVYGNGDNALGDIIHQNGPCCTSIIAASYGAKESSDRLVRC